MTGIGGRVFRTGIGLAAVLVAAGLAGLSTGSSGISFWKVLPLVGEDSPDPVWSGILWQIRLPRVLLAALAGGCLSLGGLVFQALLRNPLAEPYILGISGGSAIGAIGGILLGFSRFPGVFLCAFAGSLVTLALVILLASGGTGLKQDSLLLSGVMINAFCSSVITFFISISQDARIHNILFWLMGDLSLPDLGQAGILALIALPCFGAVFAFSHALNLLLLGRDTAQSLGVRPSRTGLALLTVTSLMVSATVSCCGLLGFVGLVIPHLFRLVLGPDHRVLVPACILGGGSYLILCDLLARSLPAQGEMPTGVITALAGAPLFVYLLKRGRP